ncbi:hypothetical protein RSIPO_02530 [Ralstonia solanacearum IPO1609]|uniref:Esterase n=1 Tax=Ralstonia solanacearum IPO1609 TaxID=564066 RepID=A0ABF7RFP9_RALSL|nr:hypothetical protein RSIPO_02530 [Ralstonia solanacearum IPO1609]
MARRRHHPGRAASPGGTARAGGYRYHTAPPERYYLLAATGDEVLDYREMLAHFPGAATRVIDGGDHGIGDFARYMDEVLVFCGVPAGLLAAHPFDDQAGA